MAIVNSGKANKQTVQALIKDMETFSGNVKGEMKKILVETISLENSWKDAQYKRFRETTVEMITVMQQQLKIFDDSVEKIRDKYKQLFGN